ncbi:MAG: ATP-binding cassette domain-containing protein [Eggerthellaceae bacterium]|nr:ATP-binding cassette domain-containing protein [Eggerthellaceae bacterium]
MLEAQNISFGYPGTGKLLYDSYSLTVEAGERVELRAPSGFGKTTFCRILAGYEKPLDGKVLVDGSPLPEKGLSPVQLILQHPELAVDPRMRMRDTLAEPVSCKGGSLLENSEVLRLMEGLGIRSEWLSRYPHELSGGELQRFCVARALLANPKYLIADEMTTMLDALTQAQIWAFLLEEIDERGMGLIFVSHSPALAQRIATRTEVLSR